MKTFSAIAALAAVSSVYAVPTPTEELVPRSSSSGTATTSSVGSLAPVTVKGNAFWVGDTRFYMRGVDWQPGGSSDPTDPMADEATCTRDIAEFKKLGLNAVRVYTVDNTADHDTCMKALDDAGIYLVLDVNTPKYSLNRATPSPSYNAPYLQSLFATIDAFAKYNNTLAFFSGNEVINDDTTTACAPYVKAVTRDMRQYIGSQGYRKIPVGYSAADVESNRYEMAAYMNCGTDDERSDFYAFNDYSWCDPSSFATAWSTKIEKLAGYGLPIFLSEYGCNTNTRKFEEVASLYGSDTSAIYSGGLVYEYSEEGSKYGLVTISGSDVTEGPDFTALQTALAAQANPTGDGGYNATGGASACPAQSDSWDVSDDSLPAIPLKAAAMMKSGAGAGPGLTGAGSQNAGDTSPGTATAGSGSVSAVSTSAASSSSGSSKKSAASSLSPMDFRPMAISGVVLFFSFFGAMLL
ncbi:1,3-beta-glucanosyltransferase [Lachnellula hyalina]|uniref:1,3-beta-glucanosyltransferase n=1 Tax=Lachnellula hyalina TaxID=1316788 RepID=A0A8H8R0P8_9HELO|nr:1,3-beta-glucanosyltransferase [Lachnellula hyalina]TVY25275.1 1,3-beta-glucanosyltransferase [Lachnellula hyalina]